MEAEENPCRLIEATNAENVDKIKKILEKDRRFTY